MVPGDRTTPIGGASSTAITQCPHCSARFRIRAEQVKVRAGLVRCGACRGVFDAIAHITKGRLDLPGLDADRKAETEAPRTIIPGFAADELAPPPVAPSSAPSVTAASAQIAPGEEGSRGPGEDQREEPVDAVGLAIRNTDYDTWRAAQKRARSATQGEASDRPTAGYRWRRPATRLTRAERAGWAVLSAFAALALAAQALYVFRDTVAAHVPELRPALARACVWLGCRIVPPRALASAGLVNSELAADPAHKGLLIFTATLRNSSDATVAFPHLILTLEAADGQAVARKVFSPAQYLPASARAEEGLPGQTDVEIKLYLDASQVNAVGFKVDQAYL